MWVPSDLESDSEDEVEEGAKRKKTEDEEDSGGEFSSEGIVLFYFFRCVTSCTRTFPSLKGFFTWHLGTFFGSASPLRFSLMALYLVTCYHQKILLWLSHTGTSSLRLLCRSQNFILPRDLVTVSYKRRMTMRFGRNWLLDGLVCVARKSSFSESKTVSFSNPRAQASDSFSSVVMRNTNWRLPFVVNVNLRVLNIWCGDCYVKIVLINRLLFSTEEDEIHETKNQDTFKRTIKVKSRGSINC